MAVSWLLLCLWQTAVASNTTRLPLLDGGAEVEWVSASTVRIARRWGAMPKEAAPITTAAVPVQRSETATAWRFESSDLALEIRKPDFRLRLRSSSGKELLRDREPMTRSARSIRIVRESPQTEEFYGLGPRIEATLGARRRTIQTRYPFLISSAGYGLWHRSGGDATFDLAATALDRYTVEFPAADTIEFFFYYGPTPKEILEEHLKVQPYVEPARRSLLNILENPPSYASLLPDLDLCACLRALSHGAMTGLLWPALDLALFRQSPRQQYQRAGQLGAWLPLLADSKTARDAPRAAAERLRRRWIPYLITYVQEAHDRGYPVVRPLALQYPGDREGAGTIDQFLIGDELLLAPVCDGADRRSVYLPRGIWTEWRTNAIHQGRQRITVEAPLDEHPLFARNGSIVPVDSGDNRPMMMHYFPRLAAEFFLWEPDLQEISQFHAAPAAEFLRLETESRKDRVYEWVAHHTPPATEVRDGDRRYTPVDRRDSMRPGTWFHDASRNNLHVMIEGGADQDRIVNIRF